MQFTTTSLLLGALAAQQATATWNVFANPFSSPENCDNKCDDGQKGGFDWGTLTPGQSVGSYGGFGFNGGWKCSSKFGKRDTLTKRTFQDKCITGSISKGSGGPSFSHPDKGFSIDEFQISVSIDTEVEFHYTMGDNSICKETHSCSKSGTTVKNTQCGGASSVTFQIPSHGKPNGCDLGIHSIGFNCNPSSTKTRATATPTPTPNRSTPPAYSTPATVYTPPAESTPVKSTPVESKSTPKPSTPASTPASTPVSTPVNTLPPYGNFSTPSVSKPESTPVPTTIVSSVVESTPASSPVESTPASSPVESTPVSTPVSSAVVSSTLTEATVASSTPGGYTSAASTPAVPVPSPSSPAGSCTPQSSIPEILPRCFNTWMLPACKDNADYSCYCGDAAFTKKIYDCVSAWESDSALISQALSYFVGLCAQFVPQNPGLISNCPGTVTLGPAPPAPPAATCVASTPVAVSSNSPATTPGSPAITPAPTPSSPAGSTYLTTLTVSQTVTVPCTISTGVSAGFTIPSSYTVSTYSTTVTVPQVAFTSTAVTVSGSTSQTINVIPGTPAPIAANPTKTFGTVTVPTGTATALPSQFTGAAVKGAAPFTGAAVAAILAVFAL